MFGPESNRQLIQELTRTKRSFKKPREAHFFFAAPAAKFWKHDTVVEIIFDLPFGFPINNIISLSSLSERTFLVVFDDLFGCWTLT